MEPDFRSSWNFTSVIFMSMGACVPIFRKIHYLLLPFAYYFCSNMLLDLGDLCNCEFYIGWIVAHITYSTRIKELGNWREAISGKRLGFMMKFFTTKCTYRCTILFKVLEPFRWIHFFFCKKIFFSFLTILTRKITPKKIPLRCMLVRHIYTNFFFCWRFSANFCAYGTQNSKNTKSGISH